MKFIFYHHEPHGPFSLEQLYSGEICYGGSVGRLRLLFWIAQLGHQVYLIGNVKDSELEGVQASAGISALESVIRDSSVNNPCVLVLNNPPSKAQWHWLKKFKNNNLRIILWAGNPLDWIWLDEVAAGSLDRIVCVSHTHREAYRLYPGFEKIEVLCDGGATDLIQTASVQLSITPTVLFLSVPRKTKGFHNLLHAWRIVHNAVPEARLRVCGSARMHNPDAVLGCTGILDADLEAEFPDFFGDYPNSTKCTGIELMNVRTLPEVYSDLKAATVAVVNCNWRGSAETFCRSAVEAQVAGVPVVGAMRGSLPEVVAHGKTGLLVDKDNPVALAQAIITLLEDETLRKRMGADGPVWARQFADCTIAAQGWEVIAQRILKDEPVPSEPYQWQDVLRHIGYGRMRLWLRNQVKKRFYAKKCYF